MKFRAKMEAPDEGEDILEDLSDGLEALTALPVWFLSTWSLISGKFRKPDIRYRPIGKI